MHRKLLQSQLPPLPSLFSPPTVPKDSSTSAARSKGKRRRRDYTSASWNEYFEKRQLVEINGDFCVYSSGNDGPVLLLLHGGGHSALSWAMMTKILLDQCNCQVVAFDSRGHGDTVTGNPDDLSVDTQARDAANVMKALYSETPPSVVLLGHSMGGAIAVHTASLKLIPFLVGLVVIDVVEGSAMSALSSMQGVLGDRPKSFESLEKAIEWSVRSGQIRNSDSARVSMPGQVEKVPATDDVETRQRGIMDDTIDEEGDNMPSTQEDVAQVSKHTQYKYVWRIDLSKTEPHWKGWFEGLSKKFLTCNAAKLLLLAGVDRLDTDLTIGQMQGKFEMHVLPQVGHTVHEDSPNTVADVLSHFLVRNKFAQPKENYTTSVPAC